MSAKRATRNIGMPAIILLLGDRFGYVPCDGRARLRVGIFMLRAYFAPGITRARWGLGYRIDAAPTSGEKADDPRTDLVPVMEGDKQKGTIIVSVSDSVFSADNPAHVKTANAIEIRLADQDLLPR